MSNKITLLRGTLVLGAIFLVFDQFNNDTPGLLRDNSKVKRRLAAIDSFGIFAKGACYDGGKQPYPGIIYFPGAVPSKELCAELCEPYADCLGFSFGVTAKDCTLHYDGYIDTDDKTSGTNYPIITGPAAPYPGYCVSDPFIGSGPVSNVGVGFSSTDSVCFEKGSLTPGNLDKLSHYSSIGIGGCVDFDGNPYDYVAIDLGSFGTPEICAEKCDIHDNSVGFEVHSVTNRCKCLFNDGDLPVPLPPYLDPYEPTTAGQAGIGEGEISEYTNNGVLYQNSNCYKNTALATAAAPLAVNGDPLFTGFQGQVFKFDGRDRAWYANVAAKSLQWNLRFGKFDTCPQEEDTFVTGTAMTILRPGPPGQPEEVAHSIVVEVVDLDKIAPECSSRVCLGNGSLKISIDGQDIVYTGDYPLANVGGRVVAHNTYAACSRKWYDFEKMSPDSNESTLRTTRELRSGKASVDYILQSRGEMIDSEECEGWLNDRIANDDLFEQGGQWATVHIRTPLISFHVEYRQNDGMDGGCAFNSIDAWITDASTIMKGQQWKGIIGETRYPKYYADGRPITSDRVMLLVGKDDEDYEVDGPTGVAFKARGM